jgi:Ion channel
MSARAWVETFAGVAVVFMVLSDIFRAAVLPRPAVGKLLLVKYLLRWLWRGWRWMGTRPTRAASRESRLAAFGPVSVFIMFGIWALGLIFGYALLLHGIGAGLRPAPQSFGEALYFSAATFVPLSYGEIVPIDVPARITTVAESGSGVILTALVITLLFSLYQSFQRREELVVTLDAMAGAPPSGLQILETAAERGMRRELVGTFDDWRRWAAAVLESHLAYPTLLYFRSSHDNEAWLNSFGAVMDAATLVMSTVEEESRGPAHLMFTVGKHLVEDLAWYFRLGRSPEPYVERTEFDAAIARLSRVGYECRQADAAWGEFANLRARYAYPLNQMAKRLAIIPAPWIGDRSYVPHERVPARARRVRRISRRPRHQDGDE